MAKRIDQFNLPYRPNLSVAKEKVDSLFGLMNLMDTQQIKQFSMINNVPLNVDDINGENLIHKAINTENILKKEFHRLNIIKFLVQNGVNPDKPNKDNQTPLHLACKYQYADITEYLVSLGVNLNYQDNYGAVPFHYALQGSLALMEPSKEIREFISKPKKIDEEKRLVLIEIKKKIWDVVKDSPFITSIKTTVDNSIYSDKKIKDRTVEFYTKATKTSTSVSAENYLKNYKESIEILRNSIDSTVKSKWNDFPELRNIEIHEKDANSFNFADSKFSHLKDIDIKDQLKETIVKNKDDLKRACSSVEGDANKKFEDHPENNILKKLANIYSFLIKSNFSSFGTVTVPKTGGGTTDVLVKASEGNFRNSEQILKDNLNPKSYDMADNYIDWDNLIFFGGSRDVIVTYVWDQLKFIMNLNSIEKKVFYILLNTPSTTALQTQIDSLNTVDISGTIAKIGMDDYRKNVLSVAYKFIFEQDLSVLRTQITDINENKKLISWLQRLDKKDISKASLFYGLLNQSYQKERLNVGFISPLLNLTSALHYSDKNNMTLDDALNNSFKKYLIAEILNNNPEIGTKTINEKIYACINVLLSEKLVSDLQSYFVYATNSEIFDKIGQLNSDTDNKTDIFAELQKMIVDKILIMKSKPMESDIVTLLSYINKSCYNTRDTCDTTYYRINELPDVDTLFVRMKQMFSEDLANKILHLVNAQNNTVLIQYIYLLLELSYTDDALKVLVKTYGLNKLKEANHLGLYFQGFLPEIKLPRNNLIKIKHPVTNKDENVLLFNSAGHKFKDAINLENNQIPLIGNYLKLQAGQQLDNIDKLINYFPYIEGRYRPPIWDEAMEYNPLTIKFYKDRKVLFRVLHKLLYTGEDGKNLYSSIDSNSKLASIFTEYYPLISLLNDVINMEEVRKTVRTIVSSLNNYNANLLLYYYIFSPDKLYKVPKFNYYEIPQESGKFLYFNGSEELNLNANLSVADGTPESVINEDKVDYIRKNYVLDNIGRIKAVHERILQNLVVGKYEIRKDAMVRAKQSALPPALKPVLADFYKYNLVNLLVEKIPSVQPLIDEVFKLNLFEDDETILFDKTVSTNYVLAKLIEELVKEHMKYYIQTQTYRIITTQFGKSTPPAGMDQILLPPTEFELSLNDTTFSEDDLKAIDKDYLQSAFQFSKVSSENKNNFIIYPEEYANSEILRMKYELIINDKSYSKLLEENANPYVLDANNQSAIYPVLKLHNFDVISKLKTNLDFRVYNDIEGNLTSYGFLIDELNNHVHKISGDKKYFRDWIENFVLYQKNEVKTLILSNDKFGNNVPRYLEESFNVICYIANQYLSESIHKIENADDKLLIENYLGLHNFVFKEYLYANKIIAKLDVYENSIDNIIEDIVDTIQNEENKLEQKIKVLNSGKTRTGLEDLKSKFSKEKTTYTSLIESGNKMVEQTLNDNKIMPRYLSLNNYPIVLSKILTKLIKSDSLQNSCDILTLRSLHNEISLFTDKNRPPLAEQLKPVSKFYEHTNKISSIYFEFGKYCDNNKVLSFVRELLIFNTSLFLITSYYNLLQKILRLYFKSNSPNDDAKTIHEKVEYCLNNELLKGKSIFNVLYNEIAEKMVLNSVQLFKNQQEEFAFTQQSTKELLDSVTDLLTVNPVLTIPADSPLMRTTIKEINSYFDTFTGKTILNWMVVIENVFKFNINQGRIVQSIDKLLN